MACVGLASNSANSAVAADAGVFSCTAPPTGTKANLGDFYSSSSAITGTSFVCVTGAAPT